MSCSTRMLGIELGSSPKSIVVSPALGGTLHRKYSPTLPSPDSLHRKSVSPPPSSHMYRAWSQIGVLHGECEERLGPCFRGAVRMWEQAHAQRMWRSEEWCQGLRQCGQIPHFSNGGSKARQGRTLGHSVQKSSSGLGLCFSLRRNGTHSRAGA